MTLERAVVARAAAGERRGAVMCGLCGRAGRTIAFYGDRACDPCAFATLDDLAAHGLLRPPAPLDARALTRDYDPFTSPADQAARLKSLDATIGWGRAGRILDTLAVAVPLRIAELQQLAGDTRAAQIQAWTSNASVPILECSDALMFGGKGGGGRKARDVFDHLARAVAAMAFAEGGATFFGQHWCVDHDACLAADSEVATRPAATPTPRLPARRRPPVAIRPVQMDLFGEAS